jgi:hypothetical protein
VQRLGCIKSKNNIFPDGFPQSKFTQNGKSAGKYFIFGFYATLKVARLLSGYKSNKITIFRSISPQPFEPRMPKSSKRKASESSIAADNVSNAINTASSIKRSRITANQPISPTSELPPVEVGTAANSAQIDEGLVIADGITNERVSASTKALYTSNFRIISKRCAEIDPSSIDSDG